MDFIRIRKVAQKIGIGESTAWLWIKQGRLPRPTKLSPRVSVWDSNVIDTLIKQWVTDAMQGHDVSKDSWQTVLERAEKAG